MYSSIPLEGGFGGWEFDSALGLIVAAKENNDSSKLERIFAQYKKGVQMSLIQRVNCLNLTSLSTIRF